MERSLTGFDSDRQYIFLQSVLHPRVFDDIPKKTEKKRMYHTAVEKKEEPSISKYHSLPETQRSVNEKRQNDQVDN